MPNSDYLPTPQSALFPSRLSRQLARIESQAAVARQIDSARIERVAQAAQRGQVAVAQLAATGALLADLAPDARPELSAIRRAATISIAGIVFQAGQ